MAPIVQASSMSDIHLEPRQMTIIDDGITCDATTIARNARLRSGYFSQFVPLESSMLAFILSSLIALLLTANSRLRRHGVFYVCIVSAIMAMSQITISSHIAGREMMKVSYCSNCESSSSLNMTARVLRTFTPWVADWVLTLRLMALYPTSITSKLKLALIYIPTFTFKVVRLGLLIWSLTIGVVFLGVPKQVWVEYVVQFVEVLFSSFMIYARIRRLSSPKFQVYVHPSLKKRFKRIMLGTVSGFLVPLTMMVMLIIVTPAARNAQFGEPWFIAQQLAVRLNVAFTTINVMLTTILFSAKEERIHAHLTCQEQRQLSCPRDTMLSLPRIAPDPSSSLESTKGHPSDEERSDPSTLIQEKQQSGEETFLTQNQVSSRPYHPSIHRVYNDRESVFSTKLPFL